MAEQDAGSKTMAELYREEVNTLGGGLSADVLRLEALCAQQTQLPEGVAQEQLRALLASMLRAAHSLKGAAKVMRFNQVADVTHELEEGLLAAQRAAIVPDQQVVDAWLLAADFINASGDWGVGQKDAQATQQQAQSCVFALQQQTLRLGKGLELAGDAQSADAEFFLQNGAGTWDGEPVLRVRAEQINELLQLGVQGRVLSHRLDQLPQGFLHISNQHFAVEHALDACLAQLAEQEMGVAQRRRLLSSVREKMSHLRRLQSKLYEQVSRCVQEQALLSERWYAQVLACRTRPFADIVSGFPRLVRDIGRALNREIVLRIEGAATLADRDIMEKLEMPLIHLLRNACSHGIEPPSVRLAAGKPQQGTITLAVTHSDGWLQVSVRDDGCGIDFDRVRDHLRAQGGLVEGVSDESLLEHIFSQGFSTAAQADAVSGRGVGLAAVSDRLRRLGGHVGVKSERGRGSVFTLHVPVTRALLRVLSLRLCGEPYALPLGRIEGLILVSALEQEQGQVLLGGQTVPIIALGKLLHQGGQVQQAGIDPQTASIAATAAAGADSPQPSAVIPQSAVTPSSTADPQPRTITSPSSAGAQASVSGVARMVVLQEMGRRYVLDAGTIEDESELIVHEMDARLGQLPLFESAGLNEKGEVVLVLDAKVLCGGMESLLAGRGAGWPRTAPCAEVGCVANTPDAEAGSAAAAPVLEAPSASALKTIAAPVSETTATPALETTAAPVRLLRILLAEDSALARARIVSMLAQAGGFDLTCVADGLAAWQKLQAQPDGFDLLLTDFEMPELNGYELAQKVRRSGVASLKTLPVVIISAKNVWAQQCCTDDSAVDLCLPKSLLDSDAAGFVETVRMAAKGDK